jgi:hypothetical protein
MVCVKPTLNRSLKARSPATRTANSGLAEAFFWPQKGARYLNPQTSLWLSADPAMGEYIPGAPINDEVRKQNQNLPGMGGVFNVVNLHTYHYAGNNPVNLTDPDGRSEDDVTREKLVRLINLPIFKVSEKRMEKFREKFYRATGGRTTQEIINSYNEIDGVAPITEEILFTLFKRPFIAKEFLSADQHLHKDLRNMLNETGPRTKSELPAYSDWNQEPASAIMNLGHDPKNNEKFLSSDRHRERIFNRENGSSEDQIEHVASFNFFSFRFISLRPRFIGHFLTDIVPYWKWGN